ncbi:MAG: hypothetical protein ACLFST_04975 [Spirochaetia bacterium]
MPRVENTYQTGRIIDTQLLDEGRKKAFRHGSTVFTLYKPKLHCCLNVSSLKLSIILPCHYSVPDIIWLGQSAVRPESILMTGFLMFRYRKINSALSL